MACMDHSCPACGWWEANNQAGPKECPECGEPVVTIYDEDD